MKKGFGIFLVALISAAAGAAATIFAIKKREELEDCDFDEDDDKFFEDCDGDCEGCEGCEEVDGSDDDALDDEEVQTDEIIEDDVDEEAELNSFEDEVEDNDEPKKSDF